MLAKRIIPCLDVHAGRVVKGVNFLNLVDAGDPVAQAVVYDREGADELVFLDITATHESREIVTQMVRRVADAIFIPFTVGGGLRTLDDLRAILLAGADKVSVNSAAIRNPELVRQASVRFGSQCIVLSMQVKRVPKSKQIPSGYEIYIDGGRTPVGWDALGWSARGVDLGAGEIVVNSIDADGTKAGYELTLTGKIADLVPVPVIASGGAGNPQHLRDVFVESNADAAIVASITHYGEFTIENIKTYLAAEGVGVRNTW